MSLRRIKLEAKISRVRLNEDFTTPDVMEVIEDEIDPEEIARQEEEQRAREEYERKIKAEVDVRIQKELDQQQKIMTENFENEKKEVYELAKSEGLKEGEELAEARLEPIKKNLINIAESINEQRKKIILEAEQVIIDLAYKMARKVIGKEIERDTEVISSILSDALRFVADETSFIVRLNPEDHGIIKDQLNLLATQSGELKDIEILADEKIVRGGCMIEAESGTVDARIESKLGLIENMVKGDS